MPAFLVPIVAAAVTLPASPPEDTIPWWSGSFEAALERAGDETRPICVYFWMHGSEHCESLYQETLSTPEAAAALEPWLVVSANVQEPAGRTAVARYGVTTLPTLLFLSPAGEIDDAIIGTITVASFVAELDRIAAGTATVGTLRARCAAAPDDLSARLDLAVKLRDVGALAEADALFESIRADDPRGRTVAGARLALWEAIEAVAAAAVPGDPTTMDPAPVLALLDRTQVSAVRFEGWQYVGELERERGNRPAARAAQREAWPDCPEDRRGDFALEVAEAYWEAREELERGERRFALELAETAVAGAEELLAAAEAGGEEGAKMRGYLGSALNVLARCQLMSGKERLARATAERCLELEPGRPEHERLVEIVKAR